MENGDSLNPIINERIKNQKKRWTSKSFMMVNFLKNR